MAIKKHKKGLRAPLIGVVAGLLGVTGVGVAFSLPSAASAAKPAPAAIPKVVNDFTCPPGFACTVIPAAATTVTSSNTSSSSSTHIKVVERVTERIRQFQRATRVLVSVYQNAPDLKPNASCVDPLKMKSWHKKSGFSFRNTRGNGGPYWTGWKTGWQICGFQRIKIANHWYIKGWKKNCRNKDILIPLFVPSVKPRFALEFQSIRSFNRYYEKWVKKTNTSTSTSTSTTQYSCPQTWTPINGGKDCLLLVPLPPTPTTTVTTTTSTTTVTTTTPTPVNNTCSFSAESSKSDPTVANGVAIVSSGGNVSWSWGDGSSSSGTSVSHKYATPSPGPASSGVTYTISVSASFPSGSSPINCGSRTFFVPAPPPSATASSTSTTTSSTTSTTTTGGSPPLP